MSPLIVRLFGKFSVHRNEQELGGLSGCKLQELFCYLLLYRDRSHSRESLAALLWGDSPTAQSRKYLRQALWQLQTALQALDESAAARTLEVESDRVRLKAGDGLWLDVAEFERAFALVCGVPVQQLDAAQVAVVQRAVDLYQGDLLEGWYQDWCLHERERLQDMYLTMLDKLMDHCRARHEYENALAYGVQILRYDRARECTHQRLMQVRYLAGDRAGALRQYQRCVAALDEELGVRPAEGTVGLYDQIRMGRLEASARAGGFEIGAERSRGPLVDVLSRLKQLEAALVDLQQRVHENIGVLAQLVAGRRQRPQRALHGGRPASARRASGS